MGSPFKMKPKTPMMKALVGKQGNLPQHLQDKIKAAPESPAKSYGSKTKSPMMKVGKPTDKSRSSVGRGGADVVLDEKDEIVNRRDNINSGKRDFEQVTQTVQKGTSKSRAAKLKKALENKNFDEARSQSTMAKREGAGRMATKTYQRGKGQKGAYTMMSSKIAGTKGMRTLADGSEVMIEDTAQAFKKKGLITPKPKARKLIGKANKITPKKATTGKPSTKGTEELKKKTTSPVKKKGVKALEAQRGTKNASPIKKYGSKKSPVMQQKLKKKATKGKTKLPKLVVNTPKGPKAPRGPQRGSIGGVNVSIQTKGRSTKNTDLLEVGKKYYKKAKKYVKSKMN